MTRLIPLLCLALLACQEPPDPDPEGATLDTLPTAQRLAEEGMDRWPSDSLAFSWIETVWHFGLHRTALRTGEPAPTAAIDAWLDRGLGFFEGTDPRVFDSSDSMSPATLASIRALDGPRTDLDPILDAAWHYLDEDALTTSEGAITHWGEGAAIDASDEVWVDSQFMFGMFLLAEHDRTGDPALLDRFVEQYVLFSDLCRDPTDQLYRHAYNDTTGTNIPTEAVYWARGNSWVLISAAEYLARADREGAGYAQVASLFEAHVDAVTAVQADDGLWHTVLNSPQGPDPANYTETSASALIAYALARGTDSVLTDGAVDPVLTRAVRGLEGRLTEVDGQLSLAGTSFGTNPGDYDYYVGIVQLDDQLLGVGSVLMAFAEADGREEVP